MNISVLCPLVRIFPVPADESMEVVSDGLETATSTNGTNSSHDGWLTI